MLTEQTGTIGTVPARTSSDQTFVKADIDHGSGHASYDEPLSTPLSEDRIYRVPMVRATAETLAGFATVFPIADYAKEKVRIVPWPRLPGQRPIDHGSGEGGGYTEGDFIFQWDDTQRVLKARNHAVGGDYITGALPVAEGDDASTKRTAVLVREANFHPDGGQIVAPREPGHPFIMLLAKPNENVQLSDFVAFYFDGSQGCQILPGTWHQPAYPLENTVEFRNKQGRVHACVTFDSVTEVGKWMLVPLDPSVLDDEQQCS